MKAKIGNARPHGRYRAAEFFVLRAPLLSFDEWQGFGAGLTAVPAGDAAPVGPAIAGDVSLLRSRLTDMLGRPEIAEAIFLASPSLFASIAAWKADPDSERGQKVEGALVRYFARMTGRATPFGLFAGCTHGTWAPHVQIELSAAATHKRHSRLDNDFLQSLIEHLLTDPRLREHVKYRQNSSLYHAGGQIRYAEGRQAATGRSYHLVAIEESPHLLSSLQVAAAGACRSELIESLLDGSVDIQEASGFVDQLIEHQVLVPELMLSVSGNEPAHELLERLGQLNLGYLGPVTTALQLAQDSLGTLDRQGIGRSPQHYLAIAEQLTGALPGLASSPRFQVDMVTSTAALTLSDNVRRELLRGAEILQHFVDPDPDRDLLRRFRDRFSERYAEREVPLQEALDEDIGIGFAVDSNWAAEAVPLLAGMEFPARPNERLIPWSNQQMRLFELLHRSLAQRQSEICLSDSDLHELIGERAVFLRESCSVTASLLARDAAAVAAGDFHLYLHGVSGPPGAGLLGRFCHGDHELAQQVGKYLLDEESQRPEAIFAEVIHLPNGRVGNILLRPRLRAYEIPYLGSSGLSADKQIPVSELLVSLRRSRIVLRSSRLNREIIPRQTTAHDAEHPRNLGVYRFLCALQNQDYAPMGGIWGAGLSRLPFLPRVVAGRLILSRGRWLLNEAQINAVTAGSRAQRFAAIQQLRAELSLPQLVALADGDNQLPVDLNNVLSVEATVQILKGRQSAKLLEVFAGENELCAHGPGGRFVHELIVPLLSIDPLTPSRLDSGWPAAATPRTFTPGSDWLFAKLYTGTATADHLLGDIFREVIKPCLTTGAVDGWFFVRYADPDWHIRLRLHGTAQRLFQEVLPLLSDAANRSLQKSQIWKYQLDTYEREVERYGGPIGIRLAERIFHHDSEAVVNLLDCLVGDESVDWRWRLTLLGIDALLNDLGFELAAKSALLRSLCQSWRSEFGIGTDFLRTLGERYRAEQPLLSQLLTGANALQTAMPSARAAIKLRSTRLAPTCEELRHAIAAGQVTTSMATFAASLIHMHANRMLRVTHRRQELVLCEILNRLYESKTARDRSSGSSRVASR